MASMQSDITPKPTLFIPTIDIAPYIEANGAPATKADIVSQVRAAAAEYGFLQIVGHGVSPDVQAGIVEAAKSFFALPYAAKERLSLKHSPSRHGYERLREQILDPMALADEKEGFYVGREEPVEKGFRQGPNQWPTDLPSSTFREPVEAYYAAMLRLAHTMTELLTLGLGQDVTKLADISREPAMNLKLLHYPPAGEEVQDENNPDTRQRFGAGAHADFGFLTLLLQQPGRDGLQVQVDEAAGPSGKAWMPVPAVADVLVVNVGDMLSQWTRGAYRSAIHRVLPVDRSVSRYSVACFYEGDYRATNPFVRAGEEPGNTVETYIRRRFDRSYKLEETAGTA